MECHCRPRFSWQPTTASHDGAPMSRPLLLARRVSTRACAARDARTQDLLVDPQPLPAQPAPLQPFIATYQVFHGGRELGEATMQLVHADGERWRIDLGMKGHGLMRLTGLNLQQSTVFDADGVGF